MRDYVRFYWARPAGRVAIVAIPVGIVLGLWEAIGVASFGWLPLTLSVIGFLALIVFIVQDKQHARHNEKEQL